MDVPQMIEDATRRHYRLLAPLIQAGEEKTPATHPSVPLRADQVEALAAKGVIDPNPTGAAGVMNKEH